MSHRPLHVAGTNSERTKAHNRRVVLGYMQRSGGAGRAEIARSSGLSTQTVSNLIAELEVEGLVLAAGRRRSMRGQPPIVYEFNPDAAAALGFEVRPDALVMVLANLGGAVLASRQVPLQNAAPETVFALMADLAQAERANAPARRIIGAGLVIPGPFGVEGLSAAGATVLPDWGGVDAAAAASEALGMPVLLEKDATAAAIAERHSGVAQGLDSYCFLYFGAGLGLGVMAQGLPQRGAFGNAGEIGHVIVRPGGLACDCHNSGCLEQYVSRMALLRHLAQRGLPTGNDAADEVALALLSSGDRALSLWLDEAAAALSQAVGLLENLFDPQAVILGGALPDALLDDLIRRLALPPGSVARRAGRLVPRVLRGASGPATAALGGAALIIHDTVTPRLDLTS
ncbi:ROK family transcriptional regulator [Phaeovulum sp.]|uniref:ROK family transcriptional regulator n=1 Tax=Phaeovulum sp. TaxID=2934796 RepID=UPI002730A8E4|nr:ROK family transcriptional regulator [Phaeovulum sp.]MDP1670249.1 ROK family transcriptional regulator [Phaeovulum sp.]MDP2062855.1 ROK family transcriptional regulator [Phaeovulum sp.]MDZ4120255.1 ROK family transcriptional regulator [Phaeovulum sp.]